MEQSSPSSRPAGQPAPDQSATAGYRTFPETRTHGPQDKSSYHGREDSRRMIAVKRLFPVGGPRGSGQR